MRATFLASLAAATLLASGAVPVQAAPKAAGKAAAQNTKIIDEGDNIVDFHSSDTQMNEAMRQARKSLPLFWRHLELHPEMDHSLKVALPTGGGSLEHIWVGDISVEGDKISAVLANDPIDLPGLSFGSPVTFSREQISDWSYVKDGKMYGHYTTRVVVKHVDPAEAAQLRAMLSENPVESDKH